MESRLANPALFGSFVWDYVQTVSKSEILNIKQVYIKKIPAKNLKVLFSKKQQNLKKKKCNCLQSQKHHLQIK